VVATRFDGHAAPTRRPDEPTIRRTRDMDRGRRGERSGELGIDVPEFLPG
jgi:hypothetical protein